MISSPALRVDDSTSGRRVGSVACGSGGASVLGVIAGHAGGVHRPNSAWRPKFIWVRCGAGSAIGGAEGVSVWLCRKKLQDEASRAAQIGRTDRTRLAKECEWIFVMETPGPQVAWERWLVPVSTGGEAQPRPLW